MSETSSVSQLSGKGSSPPRAARTPNRLHKLPAQERGKSPCRLGIKIKKPPEEYSGRTRGTLGGFLDLSDAGSTDSSRHSKETAVLGDKECILTHMTRKMGLGIYTRQRAVSNESRERKEDLDEDGDERETWYMFYPPPPSPSLAIEPEDWQSSSSTEIEARSRPASEVNLEDRSAKDTGSIASSSSKDSIYQSPPQSPPPIETATRPTRATVSNLHLNIDSLVNSAENLADQYRDLLLSATSSHTPISPAYSTASYNAPFTQSSSIPLPLAISLKLPLPLPLPLWTADQTPKTLRKVKRQHSLRRLLVPNLEHDSETVRKFRRRHSSSGSATTSSPTPTEFPSPNEPLWSMAPFTPVQPKQHLASESAKKKAKTYRGGPDPPPRESSRGRALGQSNRYETGEIPPRPTRPPLKRRNAEQVAIETEKQKRKSHRVISPRSPPPTPLQSPQMLARSKSFVLPSIVLKRQWEDAFDRAPGPGKYGDANEEKARGRAKERGMGSGRIMDEGIDMRRYGIVGMNVGGLEDGQAGWV